MSTNEERRREAMKKLDRELKNRDRQEKTKPLGVVAASVVVILAFVGGIWWLNTHEADTDSSEQAESTSSSTAASASASLDPTTEAEAESEAETTKPKPKKNQVLDGKRATPLPEMVSCTYDASSRGAARDVGLPQTADVPATGTANVTFQTNNGPVPLTLDRSASPCTVNAITYLASKGYFDDTTCHRITTSGIKVLQCGDPSGSGSGGPGFQFADEYPTDEMDGAPVVYPRGSVAMANAGPGTNGSQFFLNYGDSPLPASYTYFGTISDDGLATLDAIAERGTISGQGDGKPKETVKIETATVN